jgi:hypothetical protein
MLSCTVPSLDRKLVMWRNHVCQWSPADHAGSEFLCFSGCQAWRVSELVPMIVRDCSNTVRNYCTGVQTLSQFRVFTNAVKFSSPHFYRKLQGNLLTLADHVLEELPEASWERGACTWAPQGLTRKPAQDGVRILTPGVHLRHRNECPGPCCMITFSKITLQGASNGCSGCLVLHLCG